MGIPLAGGTNDGPGGPGGPDDDGDDADGRTGFDTLDVDGAVGDVDEGLWPVSHAVYETPGGLGLGLLVENTGTRAFEHLEVRVRVDGGDTVGEFTTASGAELGRLDPGGRWRFWVPIESGDEGISDSTTRYTVDVEAA